MNDLAGGVNWGVGIFPISEDAANRRTHEQGEAGEGSEENSRTNVLAYAFPFEPGILNGNSFES
ncbi:hypothetical protein [Corynebacterium sp.]|uniref:hypothetical protein n=1 Tax=Corynebacterium sp. TaxID=1720 RepID=UPI002A91243F|nr:hypothetical protein [Corynebacterium sp.]MDY5785978.1 hypothetical protein [Corynebacterium sp.]